MGCRAAKPRAETAIVKACLNCHGSWPRPSWPGFAPRQDLVLENLLLRHQLTVLTRPTRTRPRARLRTCDKLLWVLARRFCAGWHEHLSIVTPDTVVRWHLFWRWKSRSRGGRPHLSPQVRELISTMSRENRLWGTERIRGELLKLGIVVGRRHRRSPS
jgi:hypothetical protein